MSLSVNNLQVSFSTSRGDLSAVRNVSFDIPKGKALGLVGESGSGKSVTSLGLMRLLPSNAKMSSGSILLDGKDISKLNDSAFRKIRGSEIAMIFQDPMSSLNPCFTVEYQLKEVIALHEGGSSKAQRSRAIELLKHVGIPAPETRLGSYPHQLSGGMCQRIGIAMALASKPKVLIADEPTTALDVTIQAQILELLKTLQKEFNMSLLMITHDLGIIREVADEVCVMYTGEIVERGPTEKVLSTPSHPYTLGLLECIPGTAPEGQPLKSIPGIVPHLSKLPSGCHFHPRCSFADAKCKQVHPVLEKLQLPQHQVSCHHPRSLS